MGKKKYIKKHETLTESGRIAANVLKRVGSNHYKFSSFNPINIEFWLAMKLAVPMSFFYRDSVMRDKFWEVVEDNIKRCNFFKNLKINEISHEKMILFLHLEMKGAGTSIVDITKGIVLLLTSLFKKRWSYSDGRIFEDKFYVKLDSSIKKESVFKFFKIDEVKTS
jgi:hypothetical protein